jgi:aconitate hydratase
VASLGLTGHESFAVEGVAEALDQEGAADRRVRVRARREGGGHDVSTEVLVRIDTPQEVLYYRHGGILPFVLR